MISCVFGGFLSVLESDSIGRIAFLSPHPPTLSAWILLEIFIACTPSVSTVVVR
jgi:hypothetical protein